jgi:hypothetical protein
MIGRQLRPCMILSWYVYKVRRDSSSILDASPIFPFW